MTRKLTPLLLVLFMAGFGFAPIVLAGYSQTQYSDECKNASQNLSDLNHFYCWVGVQIFDTVNPPPNLPKTGVLTSLTFKVHSRVVNEENTNVYESGYFWRKTNADTYCYLPGFLVPNDDQWHDITLPVLSQALDGNYNRGTSNCVLDFSKEKLEYIYVNNYVVDTAWSATNVYSDPENNYQGYVNFNNPKEKSLYFKINDESFKFVTPQNNETIHSSSYSVTGSCPVNGVKQLAVSGEGPVSSLKDAGFNTDCVQGTFSFNLPLDNTVSSIYVTDKTTGNIVYVPVTVNVNTKTPVLIVPGIMGTEINKGSEIIWPDVERMMYTNNDRFMDILSYKEDNNPVDSSLSLGKIISREPRFNYSEKLVLDLESQGYESGKTLFTFPYDWRKDLSEIAKQNLKGQIDYILTQTEAGQRAGKVDIIAHSQGGLVVKRLLYELPEYKNKIEKLVFVGTPHLGAPKAAKALLYGDAMDVAFLGMGLDPLEVKRISLNMPAVYELLPSASYFGHYSGYIGKGERLNPDIQSFHIKTLDFQESKQFLKDESLNSLLIENAQDFHSQGFDNFSFENSGIKAYNIVGCQQATVGKIIKKPGGGFSLDYIAGDETVPLFSADNLPGAMTFYALKSEHGSMMTKDGIRQQIVNLISGSTLPTSGNIVPYAADCFFEGKKISVHSPVDLHIYDELGNHVGPMPDGSFEYNIEGVLYDVIGHEKFAFLPKKGNFTIKLLATGSGVFDFYSSNVQNGQTTETVFYSRISVATSSQATINLENNKIIFLDIDGNNQADQEVFPSSVLDQNQSQDLTPPISTSTIFGLMGKPGVYRENVNIILNAIDPVILNQENQTSGVLKTRYNLDNSGWRDYSSTTPIQITAEGPHLVKFYSTDKAGNNEPEQELSFIIDKTSPEFNVYFDISKKDLVFSGTDNLAKLEEIKKTEVQNKITFEDLAGNTLELVLKEKDRKKSLSAELLSLSYNGKLADITKNRFSFSWVYDKKGVLKVLIQHVLTNKNFSLVSAIFDGRNTRVLNLNQGIKPETKTYQGLKLIKIKSNQGKLLWEMK